MSSQCCSRSPWGRGSAAHYRGLLPGREPARGGRGWPFLLPRRWSQCGWNAAPAIRATTLRWEALQMAFTTTGQGDQASRKVAISSFYTSLIIFPASPGDHLCRPDHARHPPDAAASIIPVAHLAPRGRPPATPASADRAYYRPVHHGTNTDSPPTSVHPALTSPTCHFATRHGVVCPASHGVKRTATPPEPSPPGVHGGVVPCRDPFRGPPGPLTFIGVALQPRCSPCGG